MFIFLCNVTLLNVRHMEFARLTIRHPGSSALPNRASVLRALQIIALLLLNFCIIFCHLIFFGPW